MKKKAKFRSTFDAPFEGLRRHLLRYWYRVYRDCWNYNGGVEVADVLNDKLIEVDDILKSMDKEVKLLHDWNREMSGTLESHKKVAKRQSDRIQKSYRRLEKKLSDKYIC